MFSGLMENLMGNIILVLTESWTAGGDCKTVMFVQISPSTADLGETLCSLNFASRVRGIESGPARKQVDLTELYKYKQMVWQIDESFNLQLFGWIQFVWPLVID